MAIPAGLDVTHHYLDRPGDVRFHYVTQGDKASSETIVLVHGCPEFWYEWRHVIPRLARAGFRCLAIDMRGFGETTCPLKDESYMFSAVVDDIVAMLDREKVARAHVVGHDWGGPPAWLIARHRPDRLKSVAVLSTPHVPEPPRFVPTAVMAKVAPQFAYQVVLQHNNCLDAAREFAVDSKRSYRMWFEAAARSRERHAEKEAATSAATRRPVVSLPTVPGQSVFQHTPSELASCRLLTEAEVAFYARQADARPHQWLSMMYWYRDEKRKLDFDWAKANRVSPQVTIPALMVTSEYDPVLTAEMSKNMEQFIPNLKRAHAANSGHWIATSEPHWLAGELIKFFRGVVPSKL